MEGVGVQRADSSTNIDVIAHEIPRERYDLSLTREAGDPLYQSRARETQKTTQVVCCCLPFFRNRKVSEESLRK